MNLQNKMRVDRTPDVKEEMISQEYANNMGKSK